MRIAYLLCLVIFACALSGCDRPTILTELSQRQANDVAAILRSHDIEATIERGKGARATFAVHVPSSRYGDALAIVSEKSLPREFPVSFDELIAEKGFLPGSRAFEKLRLDRAVARQVEEALLADREVVQAGVVVRMSYPENLEHPSVSVHLVVTEEVIGEEAYSHEQLLGRIQALLPQVPPEHVVLSFDTRSSNVEMPEVDIQGSSAEQLSPFVFGVRVLKDDIPRLVYFTLGVFLICLAFGLFIGYWFGYLAGGKESLNVDSSFSESDPLPRLESAVIASPRIEQKKPTQITEV